MPDLSKWKPSGWLWARLAVLSVQAALVVGFALTLRAGAFPLGIAGEWEWPRLADPMRALPLHLAIAMAGILAYAAFLALGWKALAKPDVRRLREGAWLLGLLGAAVGVQLATFSGAPAGFGLDKWATLAFKGPSGYYSIARTEMSDPATFLASYPDWIQKQDALHVGTHPPGLFLWARSALGLMESRPELATLIDEHLPGVLQDGFREVVGPMPRPDRASLVLTGALTLLACAATVVPLYALARGSGGSPPMAWAVASAWPLVPSAILFQPTADTAFPLLSTAALALAIRARPGSAVLAGVVLAVGMAFSLVFLAVGLIVALLYLTANSEPWKSRAALILGTGLGFLAPTLAGWALSGANPFVIWWWNQANHARFYEEFPRTYLAWLIANPIELIVALGLPLAVWAGLGLSSRAAPRVALLTLLVLVLLTLIGRNLSEVARLWLPFFPALLVAAGAGLDRLGAGAGTLAVTIGLLGVQVLVLQSWIQVVYPV